MSGSSNELPDEHEDWKPWGQWSSMNRRLYTDNYKSCLLFLLLLLLTVQFIFLKSFSLWLSLVVVRRYSISFSLALTLSQICIHKRTHTHAHIWYVRAHTHTLSFKHPSPPHPAPSWSRRKLVVVNCVLIGSSVTAHRRRAREQTDDNRHWLPLGRRAFLCVTSSTCLRVDTAVSERVLKPTTRPAGLS